MREFERVWESLREFERVWDRALERNGIQIAFIWRWRSHDKRVTLVAGKIFCFNFSFEFSGFSEQCALQFRTMHNIKERKLIVKSCTVRTVVFSLFKFRILLGWQKQKHILIFSFLQWKSSINLDSGWYELHYPGNINRVFIIKN